MNHTLRCAVGAWLAACLGCSAATVSNPTSGDAATDVAATDVTATDAGGPNRCGAEPSALVGYDRTCAGDGDCVVAIQPLNCCGDRAGFGLRRTEQSRFDAYAAQCASTFPACGCPTQGTRADDGQWALSPAAIRVSCQSGRCVTAVTAPTPCGDATCAAGQLCAPGCCGVPGCTPPPSRCVNIPAACAGAPTCACLGEAACQSGGSCVSIERGTALCICA